ncbi:MAG: hypothetical protein M1404_00985 [Acidobacteria bacterium]|nr:hypothetical protein [Acidobacteriota bacterium]
MITRRSFLKGLVVGAGIAEATSTIGLPARTAPRRAAPNEIKAFCIDFNWVHRNKASIFAPPGHWGDASPEEHVRWYDELGANVIQTFAVSCNGYAWYKNGFVPAQPGLKYDFLPDMVRLGHKKGKLVMGYFCIGANEKWGQDHPDLSYGTPYTPHIPFTDQYLDYLSKSMENAIRKTGMDGYMIDWVWNPSAGLRKRGWIPAEQELFTQLTGKPFPKNGHPAAEEELAYERKAINRCWARIKESRDKANPKCILWVSVNDFAAPSIHDSPMLKQVDWAMNESPDMKLYRIGQQMKGPQTRLIQNLVGWSTDNAPEFLSDPKNPRDNLYGFAMPRANSLPLPAEEYLSKPIDSFAGQGIYSTNDRNIAALARFYRGLPL